MIERPASRSADAVAAKKLAGASLWWAAVRPRTLSLSATPVIVGSVIAWAEGAEVQVGVFVVALAAAVLIQCGTNLFNDAEDALRGNDGPDRPGPLRVTAAGWVAARDVKTAAFAAFGVAFLGGIYLAFKGGWIIIAAGLASLFAGWAYSGGSKPLSHTAFGEAVVIAFFGVVAVAVSYLLQGGDHVLRAMVAGVAFGFLAAAVLLVNNVRDLHADRQAGRRTLALFLGPAISRYLYGVLVLSPLPLLAAAYGAERVGVAWLAILPSGWVAARFLRMRGGGDMNGQLAITSLVQIILAALFCFSMLTG